MSASGKASFLLYNLKGGGREEKNLWGRGEEEEEEERRDVTRDTLSLSFSLFFHFSFS